MVSGLQKFNAVLKHFINQSIGIVDAAGPNIPTEMLEVLWFAEPPVRIPEDGVHQVHNPERHLPVGIHPIAEILQAFFLDNGLSSAGHP